VPGTRPGMTTERLCFYPTGTSCGAVERMPIE
jgi:hypothetical protein